MDGELRILLLEDVAADAELIMRELRRGKIECTSRRADTRDGFMKEITSFAPDLILADYKLPSFDGLSALAIAQEQCPEVPFIFVSGALGEGLAVETLKKGATDYVLKDQLQKLVPAIKRAIDEVSERARRKRMEEALLRAKLELELRVRERTAELSITNEKLFTQIEERKQTEEELSRSYEQLRKLAAYLQSVREEERTGIAREIHDELGQVLTALKLDLSWINSRLPEDLHELSEKMQSDLELIDATIQSVKRICTELRPGILDHLGLGAAMEWQAEEFQKRTAIKCLVSIEPRDIALDKERSTTVFRIFQETLTNVMRHSNASEVKASLTARNGTVVLEVSDNGIGITGEQLSRPGSLGLLGIRERVYPFGGEVDIAGVKNRGTRVTVRMPVK